MSVTILEYMPYVCDWIRLIGHVPEDVYAVQAVWDMERDVEQEKVATHGWECFKRGEYMTVTCAFSDDTLQTKRFHESEIKKGGT